LGFESWLSSVRCGGFLQPGGIACAVKLVGAVSAAGKPPMLIKRKVARFEPADFEDRYEGALAAMLEARSQQALVHHTVLLSRRPAGARRGVEARAAAQRREQMFPVEDDVGELQHANRKLLVLPRAAQDTHAGSGRIEHAAQHLQPVSANRPGAKCHGLPPFIGAKA
jgi:hypothetical protein